MPLSLFTRFRRSPAGVPTSVRDDGTGTTTTPTTGTGTGTATATATATARVITTLAGLLVFSALIIPDQIIRLRPGAILRIPVEGILGLALLLALPAKARRWMAGLLGAALGLLTILKMIDMGFYAVLARPFDPTLDWSLLDDGISFLSDSLGRAGAVGSVIAAAVLVAAVVVLLTLSVLRLSRLVVRHHAATTRTGAALATVWVACALLGVQIVPGVPVAARTVAALTYHKTLQVPAGLADRRTFAAEAAVDAFRDTPGEQLLTGLRGKDVILAFVESYGRDAVSEPEFTSQVDPVLDAGNRRLAAAGFASRSAFLTSPVAGGGSWLAQSTFLSGLWVKNQKRYRTLMASSRLTLPSAFRAASWQTVGIEPGTIYAGPEEPFYRYHRVYNAHELGYRGPMFGWSNMPDQYALSAFQRFEYATPGRGPLLAQISLTSSHTPWAPVPRLVDWNAVGDGSVFAPMSVEGDPANVVWRDSNRVRQEYARSIGYSLDSLISYVEKYGNDNLVLVFLGDHQPSPLVTGADASRDVPITVVAHDPTVLNKISGWNWQAGLKPGPDAPVWRMDAFRDRFLTAFGS